MQNLAEMIKRSQQGDNEAVLYIVEKFRPLIGKYSKLLNYDEDAKSELTLKLIHLVKKELVLDNFRSQSDGAIVNYISCAIRNHYISLSITNQHTKNAETESDLNVPLDYLEEDICYLYDIEHSMIMEFLKATLTEREFMCIKLIVIDGWTADSVAKASGVSKQAINQCKNRALAKLKKFYA